MKKRIFFILILAAICMPAIDVSAEGGVFPVKKGVRVEALFAGNDKQPVIEADGDPEMADTIWIYYSDFSFEQFAETDGRVVLFSTGTYEFTGDADFICEEDKTDNGLIILRRTQKYQEGKGLADYSSEHAYDLGTLGFEPIYVSGNEESSVRAVYYGCDIQPYTEADGDAEMLDTWWVYFADGTFRQYAVADDTIVLFSTGTYEFSGTESFIYEADEANDGTVVLNRNRKYNAAEGLAPYESSHEYNLEELGYTRIVAVSE